MKLKSLNTAVFTAAVVYASLAVGQDAHDHAAETSATKPAVIDEHDKHEDGDAHADHGDEHTGEVKLSDAAVQRAGIRVEKARLRSLTASVVAPARVSFNTDALAHVGSVVQGRIVEIKVSVGDRVKKDDVLLIVESPELGRSQSAYVQRRTEADVAAAAVAPSKEAYDRAKKLFDESQGIALSEVQKREAEYRAATGANATSNAARQAAENELRLMGFKPEDIQKLIETGEINPRYEIRSSIGGRIIEREVTPGELVSPEKEKLMIVADTAHYWIWADVPEAKLGDIGVGSQADVTVVAAPGRRISGEVSLVSAEVDPNTRSARVRIVVENANDKLKPGMFARVTLFAAEGEAVLAVPEDAVQTIEGAPSIFVPVEGEPDTFVRRAVSIGRPVSGYVPVTSGLKENELFVASGTFILKAELGKSEAKHEH